MPKPEIREVLFPPEVIEKLWHKHQLSQYQVEQVIFAPASEARWDLDEVHGGRLIIRGETSEPAPRTVFTVLRPLGHAGSWACITAFCPSDPSYSEEVVDEEEE